MIRLLVLLVAVGTAAAGPLSADLEQQLTSARFVYVQSERKTGEWSKPAEIWFFWDQGAVWLGTRPDSWRVKRIGWKRPKARIAVGKVDGPAFEATGEVVKTPAPQQKLLDAFAKKYPDGWGKWEKSFREGFADGSRVLVKYAPR